MEKCVAEALTEYGCLLFTLPIKYSFFSLEWENELSKLTVVDEIPSHEDSVISENDEEVIGIIENNATTKAIVKKTILSDNDLKFESDIDDNIPTHFTNSKKQEIIMKFSYFRLVPAQKYHLMLQNL